MPCGQRWCWPASRGKRTLRSKSPRPPACPADAHKVLQSLVHARLVRSQSGPGGGYALVRPPGAELIGEMRYEDTYRLAYIRGLEGIMVALAEQLG